MSTTRPHAPFHYLVEITQEFLGDISESFIRRQIRNHLHKTPESLTCKDLSTLLDWIRPSVYLMIENKREAELYIERLEELAQSSPQNA